jgi:hypothetical protein
VDGKVAGDHVDFARAAVGSARHRDREVTQGGVAALRIIRIGYRRQVHGGNGLHQTPADVGRAGALASRAAEPGHRVDFLGPDASAL